MGVTDEELADRVHNGIAVGCTLFGSSPPASLIRRGGIVASVSPATPDRSIFNCVTAADAGEIEPLLDELDAVYADAGVRAWTAWIPPGHRLGSEILTARGHVLDAEPRSMGVELAGFAPPSRELPDGVELRPPRDLGEIGEINDAAYGLETAWEACLGGDPAEGHVALVADDGSGGIACVVLLAAGDDVCVNAVATLPEHQGKGLASIVLTQLLLDARERGFRTSSLQASKSGSPVYAKLGFRDVGCTEMWEKRSAAV